MLSLYFFVFTLSQAILGGLSASVQGRMVRRHTNKVVNIGAVGTISFEDGNVMWTRWVTGAFSDCTNCPSGARQIRKVSCSYFTGEQASEKLCDAKRKPMSFKECSCAPSGTMPCTGNVDRCAWTVGEVDHSGTNKDQDFDEIGCFKKSSQMSAQSVARNTPGNDYGCQGWSATVPCHGGLPFYAFRATAMSPTICFEFCLGKGLDIFGLDSSSGEVICRCGASPGLSKIWSKAVKPYVPTSNLVFDVARLTLQQDDRKLCPLRIYRYTGHVSDGSIPYHRTYVSASDIKYKEQIVCNCNISSAQAEDGLSADSRGASLAASEALQAPNWERKCWPNNCLEYAPWGGQDMPAVRQQFPPPGVAPRWREYVVIKYVWESNVDDSRKEALRRAASSWMANTCIVFQESLSNISWPYFKVGIYDNRTCYADTLGKPSRGKFPKVNLGWCSSMANWGNIMHELGHVLGMNHQQKRPDAASTYFGKGPYLIMHWENIARSMISQYTASKKDYMGSANDGDNDPWSGYSPYDFESVMHYPQGNAFEPADSDFGWLFGQRLKPTYLDVRQINDAYQCKEVVTWTTTISRATTITPAKPFPR